MRVSFDFDSTLSEEKIQRYAKHLIANNIEVIIITSRLTNERANNPTWNDDIDIVANELGIKTIIYCCQEDKYKSMPNDILFHIDDDVIELSLINSYTETKGISCYENNNWKSECNDILKTNKEK